MCTCVRGHVCVLGALIFASVSIILLIRFFGTVYIYLLFKLALNISINQSVNLLFLIES
jgi:hypothetical protein